MPTVHAWIARHTSPPQYSPTTRQATQASHAKLPRISTTSPLADFMSWNPSLNGTGNTCSMLNGTQYCALVRDNAASTITKSCIQYEIANPGFDCFKFTSNFHIDPDQFALWNPIVGSNCSNFKTGGRPILPSLFSSRYPRGDESFSKRQSKLIEYRLSFRYQLLCRCGALQAARHYINMQPLCCR